MNPQPTVYQSDTLTTTPQSQVEKIGQSCSIYSESWKNPLLTDEMLGNETHLVFTNLGSGMHSYGATANSFWKIWSWTPCILIFMYVAINKLFS